MEKKTCKTCGLQTNSRCLLTQMQIDPDKDYCSKHIQNPNVCEACGSIMLTPTFVEKDGTWKMYCGKCLSAFSTCVNCRSSSQCSFETDPSPLPKMVQQTIQQGPMTTVMTIKNPKRTEITCFKCKCFDKENNDCSRNFNFCGNLERIL